MELLWKEFCGDTKLFWGDWWLEDGVPPRLDRHGLSSCILDYCNHLGADYDYDIYYMIT